MKPISISHANVFSKTEKDVLVNIELTETDKQNIYKYNTEQKYEDYNINNVDMIAWIAVQDDNISFAFACYYPADMGETQYSIDLLTDEFCDECVAFVKDHYIGHEKEYDC